MDPRTSRVALPSNARGSPPPPAFVCRPVLRRMCRRMHAATRSAVCRGLPDRPPSSALGCGRRRAALSAHLSLLPSGGLSAFVCSSPVVRIPCEVRASYGRPRCSTSPRELPPGDTQKWTRPAMAWTPSLAPLQQRQRSARPGAQSGHASESAPPGGMAGATARSVEIALMLLHTGRKVRLGSQIWP